MEKEDKQVIMTIGLDIKDQTLYSAWVFDNPVIRLATIGYLRVLLTQLEEETLEEQE
jgi:hypothetical protein